MYNLEDHLKHATDSSAIQGVYWSARDLDSSPLGNHHFITFVYQDQAQAVRIKGKYGLDYFSEENDKDFVVYFATIGLARDGDNNITIHTNDNSDKQSIHEIAKDDNTSFLRPDFDYEGHQVPIDASTKGYKSSEHLMNDILELKNIYMAYYAENTQDYPRLAYSLVDENCAALVNTILERLGFSKDKREDIGEFTGIDWGEEDLLPSKYFAKSTGQYVPDGSYKGSSRNITVHVSANCKKADGKPQWSLLDLTYFGNAKLKNTNGNLEYDGVQASSGYVPGGSYKDSSDNIKVTLCATCQKADGSWKESDFELTDLTNAKFANMNGNLMIETN